MPKEYISDADKVKLLGVMSSIKFSGNADVISRFKCVCCNAVALYQYVATCQHVYCDICQEKVYRKTCLAKGCCIVIDELRQDSNLEREMQKLPSFCRFRKKGCTEEIPLYNYLEHTRTCQFDKNNTLPKLYKADPFIAYKEQNEAQLKELSDLLKNLQVNQTDLHDKLASVETRVEENLHEKLPLSFKEDIKRNCDLVKEDLLINIIEKVTIKLEQQKQRESQAMAEINEKINKSQEKVEAKFSEFQAKLLELQETLGRDINEKISNSVKEHEEIMDQQRESKLMMKMNEKNNQEREKVEAKFVQGQAKLKELQKTLGRDIDEKTSTLIKNQDEIMEKNLIFSKELTARVNKETEQMLTRCSNEFNEFKSEMRTAMSEKPKMLSAEVKVSLIQGLKVELDNKMEKSAREFRQINSKLTEEILEQHTEHERLAIKCSHIFDYLTEEKSTEFYWKIDGMRQLLKELRCEYRNCAFSNIFVTKENGLQMRAILEYDSQDDCLRISLEFVYNPYSGCPHLIYFHRRKFILLDQSQRKKKRDAWTISEPSFGEAEARQLMSLRAEQSLLISSKNLEKNYIKDNASIIKIVVEPLSVVYHSFFSNNGVLLWKLENYQQKKLDEIEGISDGIYSESFYSSETGYRMRVALNLNVSATDIVLYFLRGQFDDYLPSDFPHFTRLYILDQSNATVKNSLEVTTQNSEVDAETIGVFTYLQIENSKYLKNDCLLIKVFVESTE